MKENKSNTRIDDTRNEPIPKKRYSNCTRRPIGQNFLLVWLDGNISTSDSDCQKKTQQLRKVVNDVNLFTDLDECVAFLEDIRLEKVYVIVSESLTQKLVHLIHTMAQVIAIYVFCDEECQAEKYALARSKIKGVYDRVEPICEELAVAVKQCDRHYVTINFATPNENDNSSLKVNRFEPSFMYTQLFKNTLLNMEHDEREVQQMVDYCRKIYDGNTVTLKQIDEFGRDYCADKAIWWYTRYSFTFEILNRALRLLEADIIVNMGFFLHDLHRQIEQLHINQVGRYGGKSFVVYRGQGLSTTDFETLKNNQGGLMSFNCFLSTSNEKDVSLMFADSCTSESGMIGVLFVMLIDPNNTLTPFANIREESNFETEEEILFTMHTVFRIGSIRRLDNNDRLFEVQLSLTTDDDTELRALTERFSEELQYSVGWERMGRLLLQVKNVEKAEQLYNALLSQPLSERDEASYNHQLGVIKSTKGDYKEAIRFYEKSLKTWEKTLPENYANLSTCLSSIGSAYDSMAEYSTALSFYEKSLDIKQAHLPENHSDLAISYNDIGSVYENMGDYSKALFFYEKALDIKQMTLPANHPSLTTSYNNIGGLYRQMQQYAKALSFHEKALDIKQMTLPANHPDFAVSYNSIGCVYLEMEENSKAICFFEMALDIWEKTSYQDHPTLASFYNNLATVYSNAREYSKALFFYEKALLINQTLLSENHPNVAASYNNIGGVYYDMKAYSKALSFYRKALDIWQNALPEGHSNFGFSYNNIATAYSKMGENSKALFFYEKSLEIREAITPENHADLAISYNNIAMVYTNMKEHSKALTFYEKSLEQWQKTSLESHSFLAVVYSNIGLTYANVGEHLNSMDFYKKALNIYEKSPSENHLALAEIYTNIGMAYTNMNEDLSALSFYEKALQIYQQTPPVNPLALADVYNRIGVAYDNLGEHSKARSIIAKSFCITMKHLFHQIISFLTTFIRALWS
jgi:tetratricopeptide (TPR) repeat protein